MASTVEEPPVPASSVGSDEGLQSKEHGSEAGGSAAEGSQGGEEEANQLKMFKKLQERMEGDSQRLQKDMDEREQLMRERMEDWSGQKGQGVKSRGKYKDGSLSLED